MKSSNSQRWLPFPVRSAAIGAIFAGLFSIATCSPRALAGEAKEPASLPPEGAGEPGSPRTSGVRSGVLETREGLTLRLTTDLGSVKITQLAPGAAPVVRYAVNIETDAQGSSALQLVKNYSLKAKSTPSGVEITGSLPPHSNSAQFWVQFEVAIPRSYSIEVNTGVGDIMTGDIGGTALLQTQGGSITAGRIGVPGPREIAHGRPIAKLETEGGPIQVLDVAGDLTAFTAGGHINAGNIAGDASLHSGGGHIRAGQIGGRAELDTAGGNITVAQAGKFVSVHTGGGQIDFGEVRGSVRAQTGGGGIRIMYVSGPMEVESNAGSICLTRVADTVQASTSGGTITAWINPEAAAGGGPVRLGGASQLASGSGDIVVFLPRNLAATIDATVLNGSERQIEADSALHLNIQAPPNGNGPVHAMANLNGGGAPLKLRTTAGKIRLQYLDSEVALRDKLLRDQMDRLNKRMQEFGFGPIPNFQIGPDTQIAQAKHEEEAKQEELKTNTDWLDSWINDLERMFRGAISENPDECFKRFVYHPAPSYPALAQRAGIQGKVRLKVRITKEGRVEVQKVLEGEPALADAAIDAVKKWQAKPALLNGKKVEVVSTVTFDFQLR